MFLSLGCSSLSPRPEDMAADLPPEGSIDPADAARAAEIADRALAQVAAEDFAAARESAEEALEINPRSARARTALAVCYFAEASEDQPPELSNLKRAEGEYLRAERIDPADPVVGLQHAQFLAAVGHLNAAVDRLEQLLLDNPYDLDVLRRLGRIHYDMGHEARAAELLTQVVRLDPEDALGHYLLAHCLLRLAPELERSQRGAEYEKAAMEFARYRELVPEDIDGLLGEAHARFQAMLAESAEQSDWEAAVILGLYAQAISLDSEVVAAWFSQAVVLDHLARREEARASYGKALELDSEHLPSLLNMAASLSEDGRTVEAEEFLRRALAHDGLSRGERQRIEELLAK
jgi:Tfp pilus assembly protein PilF